MTMKKFSNVIFLLLFCIYTSGNTQDSKLTYIQVLPYYQSWKIDNTQANKGTENISQLSSILSINYPFSRELALSFRGAYAQVSGDVYNLNGFCDSQFAMKYRLFKYNLVLDAGINVPNGKEKLSADEFNTSRIISQNILQMHVPNLGQGLNFYAGTAWAYPLSDNVVIGLGASYQIRGEYQPGANDPMKYHPSNEFLLTGGLDYLLTNNSSVSLDIMGIFYGSDKVNDQEIFSAGRRVIANLIYRYTFKYNLLYFIIHYRDQAIDELKGTLASSENEKVNPNLLSLSANYQQRISRIINLTYSASIRIFEQTASPFSGYTIYSLSLEPKFKLSSRVELPVILKYYNGTNEAKRKLSGFDTGIGLRLWF
jgi:hypothetical protein